MRGGACMPASIMLQFGPWLQTGPSLQQSHGFPRCWWRLVREFSIGATGGFRTGSRCLAWRQLLSVLMGTILVAGVMALAVVIWKGRLKQTLLNIAHLLAALFSLRMPGSEVSLNDPQSKKIPFGVAMAF